METGMTTEDWFKRMRSGEISTQYIRTKILSIERELNQQLIYLFKSILSIVVPSAAGPLIPEDDPKTLLTTPADCETSTSRTR